MSDSVFPISHIYGLYSRSYGELQNVDLFLFMEVVSFVTPLQGAGSKKQMKISWADEHKGRIYPRYPRYPQV